MAISVCGQCGVTFNSVGAFDAHRTGAFEVRDGKGKVVKAKTRRCLTEQEMRDRGMEPNEHGRWITAAMPEGLHARDEQSA